jgi:hypothetical protein
MVESCRVYNHPAGYCKAKVLASIELSVPVLVSTCDFRHIKDGFESSPRLQLTTLCTRIMDSLSTTPVIMGVGHDSLVDHGGQASSTMPEDCPSVESSYLNFEKYPSIPLSSPIGTEESSPCSAVIIMPARPCDDLALIICHNFYTWCGSIKACHLLWP